MSKRKCILSEQSRDKYRQTHINNYFKSKAMNSLSTCTRIKKQNNASNKENDSEESIVSPKKKPRPIPTSDDESEETDVNLNEVTAKNPFNLPRYTYSEGDDTSSSETSPLTPKKRRTLKRRLFNSNKNTKTVAVGEVIEVESSDDDNDSEKVPKKIRNIKVEKENVNDLKEKKLQRHETNSCINSESASETPKTTIGVHKPKIITSTQKETKPHILKSINTNSPTSLVAEKSISMDIRAQEARPSTSTVGRKDQKLEKPISSPVKLKILQDIILTTPKKKDPHIKIKESPQSTKSIHDTKVKCSKSDLVKEENKEEEWSPIALRLFKKIEVFVTSHNHIKTLLEPAEIQLLEKFNNMKSDKYRFLCLKLYFRIHKWYNIFKLCDILKMELSGLEVAEMYKCISANGLVENDFSQEPCIDLLSNLLVKDLKDICDNFKLRTRTQKKPDLIQKLLANCNNQTTLTFNKTTEEVLRERIKEKMGYCVKLHPNLYKLFYKIHLLYTFTTSDFNTTSDLYLFLSKTEYKDITIPKYKINTDVKVFSSVSEFSRFMKAHECKQLVVDCRERKDLNTMLELCKLAFTEFKMLIESGDETLRSSYMMRFTAGHKYARILSLGAKHLARHYPDNVEEWLTFLIEQDRYNVQMRGIWYDLLVLVQYNYLKATNTAVNTIKEALQRNDLSHISYYELNNRAEMIKQNKTRRISELQRNDIACVQLKPIPECGSIEISARHVHDNQPGRKRVYREKGENGQSVFTVEEVAARHYLENGYTRWLHCESSLVTTILFVLFWDVIYESPIQDAFILEIQYFPLDLHSKEFYSNRNSAINQRLKEIDSEWPLGQLEGFIEKVWNEHAHEKSFIHDHLVEEPRDLYNIIMCIGRDKVSLILKRMIENFKDHHAGLPDLFLWNVKHKKCKFVEVKGEKDRLSTKQKLWLDFLLEIGVDAEVCYVKNIGSKAKRSIKKDEK